MSVRTCADGFSRCTVRGEVLDMYEIQYPLSPAFARMQLDLRDVKNGIAHMKQASGPKRETRGGESWRFHLSRNFISSRNQPGPIAPSYFSPRIRTGKRGHP